MSRQWIVVGLSVAFIAPSLAQAQGKVVGFVESVEQGRAVRRFVETPTQGGGRGGRIVAGAVEAKITTGRPYSAETLTEMTQALGDGNSIQNRSATKVYRDGEGRTRREMLADDGSVRSISISDPVARTNYTLDPVKKIAYQAGGNLVMPRTVEGTYTFSGRGDRQRQGDPHRLGAVVLGRAPGARDDAPQRSTQRRNGVPPSQHPPRRAGPDPLHGADRLHRPAAGCPPPAAVKRVRVLRGASGCGTETPLKHPDAP